MEVRLYSMLYCMYCTLINIPCAKFCAVKPVEVAISIYVLAITDIDEKDMVSYELLD